MKTINYLLICLNLSLLACNQGQQLKETEQKRLSDSSRVADSLQREERKKEFQKEIQKGKDSALLSRFERISKKLDSELDSIDDAHSSQNKKNGIETNNHKFTDYSTLNNDLAKVHIIYRPAEKRYDEEMNPLDAFHISNYTGLKVTTLELQYLPKEIDHRKVQNLDKYIYKEIYQVNIPSEDYIYGLRNANVFIPEKQGYYLWINATIRLSNGQLQFTKIRVWPDPFKPQKDGIIQ